MCGGLVRRLPGCAVACFWLVLQVRVSRAVVCRSVTRRVAPCCGVLCFWVPCRGALHCGALRCGVPCCLVLCRDGSVEVSLACVSVQSAVRSVADWWLGGAVRCGWLAGSVLWGPGEAFSAGVMSVRPQKNRKSFNPSPQPLQVLHEVSSKRRFHWICVDGLGILAHPTGSVRGHNLASLDKGMVYVTK